MGLWALSALGSIFYYHVAEYNWIKNITLIPFIYLFILVWIHLKPVIEFSDEKIKRIVTNTRFIQYVGWVLCIIAIVPFLEHFMQFVNVSIRMNSASVAELIENRYGDESYDQLYYMSGFGRKFNFFNNAFVMISMCIFYYQFTLSNRNKYMLTGLALAIAAVLLQAVNISARFILVKNLLVFIGLFLIFRRAMPDNTRQKAQKVLLGIVSFIIAFVTLISILRYSSVASGTSSLSIFEWLSLYFSESFLNFNGDMWTINNYCYGRNTAYILYNLFDGSHDWYYRDYMALELTTKIRMNVFYTMIGDYCSDFGFIGAFVYVSLFSYIFCRHCRASETTPLSIIILFTIPLKICIIGFTYYTFVGDAIQVFVMIGFYMCLKNKEKYVIS